MVTWSSSKRQRWRLVAIVLGVSLACRTGLAWSQCAAPLLDPGGPGQNNQTRLENYDALLEGLYDPGGATRTISLSGELHQVPPWFGSSTDCTAAVLQGDECFQPSSFADYLVSGDELSELMLVVSLGANHERMLEIHRTIEKMIADSPFADMPCVTARVDSSGIRCHRRFLPDCSHRDTASDVTVRVALAYFQASTNPQFPQAWRDIYLQKGMALAYRHLEVEYVNLPASQCLSSAVTGQPICNWVGGGATTSALGVAEIEMWIGYHQDIARMLLAAFEATRDPEFFQRAREVVDQWLIASTFNGSGPLTVGRFNFRWDTSTSTPQPKPGNPTYWNQDPAWDDSDAPRALWMGDVLRAIRLSTNVCADLSAKPYAVLRDWVQRMQVADNRPIDQSCIQWNHDGTPVSANCGTDYYYTGLGAGLHMDVGTEELQAKIDKALSQYGWTTTQTWNNTQCFGIYRGVRPMKALASAIGLDSAVYGGGTCGLEFHTVTPCRLLDTRQSGQPLTAGEQRAIQVTNLCGLPATAKALSLNVTVAEGTQLGYLTLFPDGCPVPGSSTINFAAMQTRANNAILRLSEGTSPALAVKAMLAAPGTVQLIVDVNGYFQ